MGPSIKDGIATKTKGGRSNISGHPFTLDNRKDQIGSDSYFLILLGD